MKGNETCESWMNMVEVVGRILEHTKDGNNRQYMIDEIVREERK
jgi:hypothetical protein